MGCYRQLSEVAGWQRLTDEDRARIMAELPARRSRSDRKNWPCLVKPTVSRLQNPWI